MADQNTWDKLYAAVAQEAKTDDAAAKALENLHNAAVSSDTVTFQGHVRRFLENYGEKYGLGLEDPNTILNQSLNWRDTNFPLGQESTAPEAPAPQAGITLPGFLQRNKQPNPSEGIHTGDPATSAIHSLQEQEFLDEFDKALAIENPEQRTEAMNKLFERIEAPDLLRNQWQAIHEHASKVPTANVPTDIDEQMQRQIERHKKFSETDEGKKTAAKGEELKSAAQKALEEGDQKKARLAFQDLLGHRQQEIREYSMQVEDDEGRNQELFLLELARAVARAQEQQLQQIQQARQLAGATAQQQAAQQEQASQGSPIAGIVGGLRGRSPQSSGARRLATALGKKALAAIPQARPFLIAYENRKKIIWAIIAAFLGLIVIMALFIAVFISIFNALQQFNPFGTVPANTSSLVRVVTEIQFCERLTGGWRAPEHACLWAIRLKFATLGIPTVDLVGFLSAVDRGYPDFQCGQFIWAAQQFVLKWPVFPGNVGTVYQWYTKYRDTMPGYNWVNNIDNPGLIVDDRRRLQVVRAGIPLAPANIAEGDIILYGAVSGGDPGHIAIVTSLVKDKDTGKPDYFHIVVAEANYHSGAVDLRPTTLYDGLGRGAYILGWWRLKQAIPTPTPIITPSITP